MEAITALQNAYGDSSDGETSDSSDNAVIQRKEDDLLHLKPLTSKSETGLALATVKSNPDVITKDGIYNVRVVDHVANKVVNYNPTVAEMYAPEQGPANPFKTKQQLTQKNTISGYVEEAHVSHFNFENQRRTFHSYGYAIDPSIDPSVKGDKLVVNRTDFNHDPDEKPGKKSDESDTKMSDGDSETKKSDESDTKMSDEDSETKKSDESDTKMSDEDSESKNSDEESETKNADSEMKKSEEDSETKKSDEDSETKKSDEDLESKKSDEDSETKKSDKESETKKSDEDSETKMSDEDSETKKSDKESETKKSNEKSETKKPNIGPATTSNTKSVFEKIAKRPQDKRKRLRQNDPEDIEGFLGPWGGFVDEVKVAKPDEETQKELNEMIAKRQKKGKVEEERHVEERTTLHIKDPTDYQGRSYLHIPQDVGVNLKSDMPPDKCYLPKKLIHTWSGHTKAVSSIKLFPKSGHLLLSTSMDCKVKLWEVYNKRRLLRTFAGHAKAVRDSCFNNDGTEFLTAAYDRFVKLWDTETGKCKHRFSNRKIPYCVKFNPDHNKQHLFVAGLSDKKIVTWDTRSGDIVQEYDRHLGAVNTITFVDNNTKFVSTSDDKSLRVWEWDIPVDFKYIADPSMHSMPAVTLAPNGKWLGCQSLDNRIVIFDVQTRFRLKRKKIFKGHMVAGYACQLDFSPDMSYIASGDGDGKVFVWDWKTTKLYSKFRAHETVCIGCTWHPHETSKLITCGWDGLIKLWD